MHLACTLALLALAPAARAAGFEGASIPSWGGGWSGPGDPGARGVLYNPAASGSGEGPELLFDVGVLGLQVGYWPDTRQQPYLIRVPAPQPTITFAMPLGDRFGVGSYLHVPYLRSDFTSGMLFVESALLGSWQPKDWLVVGGGLRLGMSRIGATIPLDTGELINDSVPLTGDLKLPLGHPLLQGDQLVTTVNRFTVSAVLATSIRVRSAWIHAVFRPPWILHSRSDILLRPSNEVDALLEGSVVVRVPLPMRAMLAATVPVGRLTLLPEVEYVGWRQTGQLGIDLSDLRIISSDPVFNGVLASVGLAEADFLKVAEGPQRFDLGWRDIVNPGLQAQYALKDDVDLRAGVLGTMSAVSDDVLGEYNLDFMTVTFRGGAAWEVSRRVRLSGSAEWYYSPGRVKRDANDRIAQFYDLDGFRLGVTTQVFLTPRER